MFIVKKIFGTAQQRQVKRFSSIVRNIKEWDRSYQELSDDELRQKTFLFKKRYLEGTPLDELLPEAYGVVVQACRRLTGQEVHVFGYQQKWDMIPYDVQLIGAIALHHGYIAEMQTGEGKTLTATLPLYLNALTEQPVHLVTVNDYLAERDCQWTGCILRWLGLRTSVVTHATPHHLRKEIYQADVVYGTASEFGFDYLRDNSMAMSKGEQVQRGFHFAIIDEIDSILIDEARTPLIISGPVAQSTQLYGVLHTPVAKLVSMQQSLCQKIALSAQKSIQPYLKDEALPLPKEDPSLKEATQKLWLLSKGMPKHKTLRRALEHPDLRALIDKWDLFYHMDQNKEEKLLLLSTLLIIIDEKGNDFELTDQGITAWSSMEGGSPDDFIMLDLSDGYACIDKNPSLSEKERMEQKLALNQEDGVRKERAHNIRQLLKAYLTMEKDVDYIIDHNKIVIIDEHTGRPQPGRRFSDGLHQAIEAKEHVTIQKETQTYATITLQNYFRMYKKLAGMTGTAITEAREFKEIYHLEVLQIPTYKPSQRKDFNDEIYMTEREKLHALLKEIQALHAVGRPLLIGTESVESSEKISRLLHQHRIPHTVLNAKNHAQEAQIIAEAGKPNAVTVATNMAGRGTDIKLQGNVESLGGLFVIGTTRHESRRIDRQLIGRAGRLGDRGSSKFFISFEDHLLRLFASPRLTTLLQKFRPPEGEAISATLLNHAIETAQKRVEGRNYMIRKYTLDYDDVMNRHRQEVYQFRNDVLSAESLEPLITDIFHSVANVVVNKHLHADMPEQWDLDLMCQELMHHFPIHFDDSIFTEKPFTLHHYVDSIVNHILTGLKHKIRIELEDSQILLPEEGFPSFFNDAARLFILQKIDSLWQHHLLEMDHLRTEVNLRTVAQKDPLLEFKHEAFLMFDRFRESLYFIISEQLFHMHLVPKRSSHLEALLHAMQFPANTSLFSNPLENISVREHLPDSPLSVRNGLCPCNSGKKYKKCCGQNHEIK